MTMFRPAYVPGIAFEHAGLTPCQIANVLDGLSITPSAAYSTRKLLSTYAGAALRVWRASDTHEMDIGFDTNCSLDSTALLAFCAGTTCHISKWYDQSGHGNDVISFAGNSSQTPVVVTGGALSVTMNGHVAALAVAAPTGSNFLISSGTNFFGVSQGSIFAVGNAASGGTPNIESWRNLPCLCGSDADFSGNGNMVGMSFAQTAASPVTVVPSMIGWRFAGDTVFGHTDMHADANYTFGVDASFQLRYNVADTPNVTKAYIFGGIPAIDSNTTLNNGPAVNFVIGGGGNTVLNLPFLGTIAEVITFQTELNMTDSNFLGFNQGLYWHVFWVNLFL